MRDFLSALTDLKLIVDMLSDLYWQPVKHQTANRQQMAMRKIQNKVRARFRNMTLLTASTAVSITLLVMPWGWVIGGLQGMQVIGIPLAYFLSLFFVPAALLIVLAVFTKQAEDADRHAVEFENE